MGRVVGVVGLMVVMCSPCVAQVEIVECGNSPSPPAQGVCEVTTGDANLLVEATVLTKRRVFRDGHLLIDPAGVIVCSGCDCSGQPGFGTATRVTCAEGVASPGLINLHDHVSWADSVPVDHGLERYDHRHDWRMGARGHTEINTPPTTNSVAGKSWAELRHLLVGTTSISGSGFAPLFLRNLDYSAHLDGLDESPLDYSSFPLGDIDGTMITGSCGYPSPSGPDPGEIFLPHVAEGIDAEARNEFLCLSTASLPGGLDVIQHAALVHAVGLTPTDADRLSARSGSVVWAPRSDVSLYGMTAPVLVLKNSGVRIALGTNWLPTGSMNLQRELQCAKELNENYYGNAFTDHDLLGMVTWEAASAARMNHSIGNLENGWVADVAIFDGAVREDAAAVVDAGPADVVLVLKGGLPMFGDAPVMEALGAGAGQCETMSGCLDGKRVCVTREGTANGLTLASLSSSFTDYPLFECFGAPANERTCTPFRDEGDGIDYDGVPTASDADGDGIDDGIDNCPVVFNPPRPVDGFIQGDEDADGVGDACDRCPTADGETVCVPFYVADFETGDDTEWDRVEP